jgi:hypothetical protein
LVSFYLFPLEPLGSARNGARASLSASEQRTLAHRIADGPEPAAAPKLPLVRQFVDTEGENCEKIFGNSCHWHRRRPPRESLGWAGHVEKTNPTVARRRGVPVQPPIEMKRLGLRAEAGVPNRLNSFRRSYSRGFLGRRIWARQREADTSGTGDTAKWGISQFPLINATFYVTCALPTQRP